MATYDTKYDNVNKIGNTLNDINSNAYLELIKQAENSGKEFDSTVNKANISAYNSLQADIAAAKKKTEDITKNAYGAYSGFKEGVTTQTAKSLGLNAYQKRKYEAEKALKESIDKSVLAYNSLKASGQMAAAKSEIENAQRLIGLRNKLLDASIENDKFVYDAMSKERSFEQKKINEDRDYNLRRRKLNDRIEEANNTSTQTDTTVATEKNNENHSYKVQEDERAELRAEKAYSRAKTDKEKQTIVANKYYGDAERSLAYNPNYNMPADSFTQATVKKALSDTSLSLNEKIVVLNKYASHFNTVRDNLINSNSRVSADEHLELHAENAYSRAKTDSERKNIINNKYANDKVKYISSELGISISDAKTVYDLYKPNIDAKNTFVSGDINSIISKLDFDNPDEYRNNYNTIILQYGYIMDYAVAELNSLGWMSADELSKWYNTRMKQITQYRDAINNLINSKPDMSSEELSLLNEMNEYIGVYLDNIAQKQSIDKKYASKEEYDNAKSEYEIYMQTPKGKASVMTIEELETKIENIKAEYDTASNDFQLIQNYLMNGGHLVGKTVTLSDGTVVNGENKNELYDKYLDKKNALKNDIDTYEYEKYEKQLTEPYLKLNDKQRAVIDELIDNFKYADMGSSYYNDNFYDFIDKNGYYGLPKNEQEELYSEYLLTRREELYAQLDAMYEAGEISTTDINRYREGREWYNKNISMEKDNEALKKYAKEHPVLSTLLTVVTALPGTMLDLASLSLYGIKGYEIDGYSPNTITRTLNYTRTTDTIRGTVSSNIDNGALRLLYGVGTSIADMGALLPLAFVSPELPLGVMATRAGQSGMYDASMRGASAGEAFIYGCLTAAAEAFFEKFSLSKILEGVQITGETVTKRLFSYLKNIGMDGLVGASEESFTTIANNISDYLVNGTRSQHALNVKKKMIENGSTKEEAERAAFMDDINGILLDGLGGFIANAVFITPSVASNVVNDAKSYRAINTETYMAQYINTKYEAPLTAAQTLIDNYTSGKASSDEQINKLLFNYDSDVTNVIRGLFEQATGVTLPSSNSDVVNLLKNPTANAYSNYLNQSDTTINTGISEIDNSANEYAQYMNNTKNAYAAQPLTDTSNKINTYIPEDSSDMDLKINQTIQDANDIMSGLNVETKFNSSPVEIKTTDGTLSVNSVNESSIADINIVDTMKAGRAIAEIFGDKVVYITGDMTLDGNVVSGNGLNDGNGTLYASLDSVTDDNGMLNWIVGHEIGHDVLGADGKKIKAFKDTFVKYAYNGNTAQFKADVDIQLDKIKENGVYKNTPSDELRIRAEYEVMADKFGDFIATINTTEDLKSIISENPSLWKRVLEAIRNVIKKLQAYFKDKKGNTTENSEAYKLSLNLQKAEKAIANAMREYSKKTKDQTGNIAFSSKVKPKLDNVTQSLQFKRWFGDWENHPNNASKVVNKDGTPKVVFHGSDANFTVFDLSKARQNADVPAFFFSNDIDEAGGYGNVREYYLNIRNPIYNTQSVNMRGSEIRENLINQGYDGIIIEEDGYIEYAAFYPEQIKSATDNIGTFDKSLSDVRYSLNDVVSTKDDKAYINAVKNGDMKTAQKMVDEAAKKAGYTIKAYHGTNADFTIFDKDKIGSNYGGWVELANGIYFTPSKYEAEMWGRKAKGGRVVSAYLNISNLLDANITTPSNLLMYLPDNISEKDYLLAKSSAKWWIVEARSKKLNVVDILKTEGYNGIKDLYDEGAIYREASGQYVVFEPSQIKSADPVTYDNDGNVIPLSERFNTNNNDIRYSLNDNQQQRLADKLNNDKANDINNFNDKTMQDYAEKYAKSKTNEYRDEISNLKSENAGLKRKNVSLNKAVKMAKNEIRLSDKHNLNHNKINSFVNNIVNNYHIDKTVKKDMRNMIAEAYDEIQNKAELTNDEFVNIINSIADKIMENSGSYDTSDQVYQDVQTLRKYITGITLTEPELAEIKNTLDKGWRSIFPKVRTTGDGGYARGLDSMLEDMVSRIESGNIIFPDMNISDTEIAARLAELFYEYKEAPFVKYDWGRNEGISEMSAKEMLRADLIEGFYNIPEVKTFADKQRNIQLTQRARFEGILNDLKTEIRQTRSAINIIRKQDSKAAYRSEKAAVRQTKKTVQEETTNIIKDKYRAEMTDDEKTGLLNDRKGALKELTTVDTDNIEMVENYKKAVENYAIMLESELKYKNALSVLEKGSSEYKSVESAYRSAKEKTRAWNAKAAIIENSKAFNSLVKSNEISKPKAYRTADRKKLDITVVKTTEKTSKQINNIRSKQVEKIKIKYIDSIKKRVDTLTKYATNPDVKTGRYIPEIFKNATLEFMTSLDFTKPEERISKGKVISANTNIKSNLKWQQKMKYLSDAILNDKSEIYKVALPETFGQRLNEFYSATGGKPLYQLSVSELKELNTLSSMMLSTVTNANKMHKSIYFKTVEDAVVQTAADMKKLKSVGKGNGLKNLLTYNYALPINVYERFGEAGKKLFKELSNGQNNYMNRVTRDLIGFLDSLKTKYNDIYKTARDNKGVQTFKVIGKKGEFEVSLSLNERMTIYLANKRKQYKDHIVGQNAGGYELDNELIDTLVDRHKGDKSEYRKELVKQSTISFSEDENNNVISSLSDNEKAFADEISTFLSTVVSEWGNEVTMERYGIRYFTEKNYLPIVSAKMLKESVSGNENTSAYALDNKGFTKNTTPGADNPIKLQGLLDIVVTHSADMALYSGFSIPVNNILKWLAYNEERTINGKTYRVGTQSRIKEVFGEKSIDYLYTLIKDITKANKPDYMAGYLNKGLTHVKSALVGANLRVAIQQPASIARASVVIPQPYLVVAAAKSPIQLKKNIQEGREHNALFNWKSFGYFDMDIGKPIVDKLLDRTTVIGKAKNAGMVLPGLADDMAWGVMWEAAKLKVKHDNKNITIGSEEYWNKVNELFDETILKTQVVDTVLSRTQVMRSKDFGVKQITSFMNESLTTFNTLFSDAYMATKVTDKELKKSYVKKTVRNAVVFIQSMVVLALAQSLYDASKDDDKDKPWIDRFTAEFLDNFRKNLNPLSLLPISNQAVSAFQYGSQNLLFESVDSLKSAYSKIKKFKESEYKTTKQWYDVIYYGARVGSIISGIPISNLIRDAWTGLNEILASTGNSAIGAEYSISDYGSKMYKAIVNKDTEKYDKAYGQAYDKLIKSGKTKTQAESAIQSAIISQLKKDTDVIEAANLRIAGKFSEASKLISKVSGKGFNLQDVQDAVKSLDTSYQNQIGAAAQHIIDGNQAEADKIISALQYQGNDKKTIDADIEAAKAEKQKEKAKVYRYANSQKEGVSDEIISYSEMKRTDFKGKDENHDGRADSGTIKADIRNYVLGLSGLSAKQRQTLYEDMLGSDTNPGSLEEYSNAKSKLSKIPDFKKKLTIKEQEEVYVSASNYFTDETPEIHIKVAAMAGIDVATYLAYRKINSKETTDYDKYGKAITNSQRDKIVANINNSNLSYDAKVFLIAYSGYKLSSYSGLTKYISSLNVSDTIKNAMYVKCNVPVKNKNGNPLTDEEKDKILKKAGFRAE